MAARPLLGGVLALAALAPLGAAQDAGGRRPETPAEKQLLDHANLYRAALDLPPLIRDDELSYHCLLHALYQDRNSTTGHAEDPKLPGYTVDGHNAGMASVLAYTSPKTSIDMWMDSFLHRIPCITPVGDRAGVGWHSGKAVTSALLDTRRKSNRGRLPKAELHWPPDDMVGAPTRMSREQPNPTPYPSSDQAGYPVTCTFHPSRRVDKASAKLWHGMTQISGFFSSPDRPTRHGVGLQQNTICLIPEKPLPHGKRLRVEMTAVVDGKPWRAEWTFQTGSRTAGFKWMQKHRAERLAREARERALKAKGVRKQKIKDLKVAKQKLAVAKGVLMVVPDRGLANAIRAARATREVLPDKLVPDLGRALKKAERRLGTLVDAKLGEAAKLLKAGEATKAAAAVESAAALASGLAPWSELIALARKRGGTSVAAGAGKKKTTGYKAPPGWQTLLTDKLTKAWDSPTSVAGGLKTENGGLTLKATTAAVTIAYLYFTDDWKDYELKAEVQVKTGGALVLRARLEKGEYKGAYIWLDPTRAGEWVTLHATVSGNTVTVTCGDQTITETTKSTKGGLIFYAQPPDEVLKVKNVRVRR